MINGILKIISKILACGLKTRISELIDPSQFAFLYGRSILDSVAIAQEIMSACTKHNWTAFFLKVDFAKAFDTMDWSFLLKVLQIRGFSDRWCSCILTLLSSGFFFVPINGQPGASFRCKCRLRQWDPLSSCLFIFEVYVLSRMMNIAYEGGFVQKVGPWKSAISCLEYTDDTIMLLPPDLVSIKRVKILIFIFELRLGLSINFHKLSLYQLGPPILELSQVSDLLHCKIEIFSFTHLGLPLKLITLSKTDWQLLLDRIDKRLVAWKGHSLSRGGRLILVNSVLTMLSLYFMPFFFLP